MSTSKGYYSVIQYCPDLARLEAANVGVLLFCPAPHFLRARTAASNRRIRQFFGSKDGDWDQINALKAAVEERLEAERERFRTLADLEHFIATRGNEIQLTPARPVKVLNPEQDLDLLFRRLVGGAVRPTTEVTTARRLEESLAEESLAPFIRRDVSVTVRAFHRTLTVPFGYQNGYFTLIQPTNFTQLSPSKTIARACRFAVEGRSLFEHPDDQLGKMQMLVVGEFATGQDEARAVVRDIFEDNDVRLFTLVDLAGLVEEIRRTGKVLSACGPAR